VMRRSFCDSFMISNIQVSGMKVLYHDKLRQTKFEVAAGDEFHMSLIVELESGDESGDDPYITYDVTELRIPKDNTRQMKATANEANESGNAFDGKLIAHLICSELAKFDDETDRKDETYRPDANPINSDPLCRREDRDKKSVREDIEYLGTFFKILTKYTAIFVEPEIGAAAAPNPAAIQTDEDANMRLAADSQISKNDAQPCVNNEVTFTEELTLKILEQLIGFFDPKSKMLNWDEQILKILMPAKYSIEADYTHLLSEKTLVRLGSKELPPKQKAALATIALQKILFASISRTDPRIATLIEDINSIEEKLHAINLEPSASPPPPVPAPVPEPVARPPVCSLEPQKQPEPQKPLPRAPLPQLEPTYAFMPPILKLTPLTKRPLTQTSPTKMQGPRGVNLETNKPESRFGTVQLLRLDSIRLSVHYRPSRGEIQDSDQRNSVGQL
jgi:hypothetical protein